MRDVHLPHFGGIMPRRSEHVRCPLEKFWRLHFFEVRLKNRSDAGFLGKGAFAFASSQPRPYMLRRPLRACSACHFGAGQAERAAGPENRSAESRLRRPSTAAKRQRGFGGRAQRGAARGARGVPGARIRRRRRGGRISIRCWLSEVGKRPDKK